MSRCDDKKEGEEKMRRKKLIKYDVENEAFERCLYAIGASINDLNEQMEGVD